MPTRCPPFLLIAACLTSVAAPARAQEEPYYPSPSPVTAATPEPGPSALPFPLPMADDEEAETETPGNGKATAAPAPGDEISTPDPVPEPDPRLDGLLANSPFLPEGFRPPGEGNAGARQPEAPPQRAVELRGVYELNGETHVNLFNLGTQKGEWLKVGEQRGPYHVQRYDTARHVAFVTVGGRAEEIGMKRPSDQPIPVQQAPASPIPSPSAVAGSSPSVTPSTRPTPGTPMPRPRRIVLPPTTPSAAAAAASGGGRGNVVAASPGAPGTGNTVINIDVPDPNNPTPSTDSSGSPTGSVPVLRPGGGNAVDVTAGTLTPEQLIQMLQSRSGQNP